MLHFNKVPSEPYQLGEHWPMGIDGDHLFVFALDILSRKPFKNKCLGIDYVFGDYYIYCYNLLTRCWFALEIVDGNQILENFSSYQFFKACFTRTIKYENGQIGLPGFLFFDQIDNSCNFYYLEIDVNNSTSKINKLQINDLDGTFGQFEQSLHAAAYYTYDQRNFYFILDYDVDAKFSETTNAAIWTGRKKYFSVYHVFQLTAKPEGQPWTWECLTNEAIKQISDGLRKDDAAMFSLVEMLDSLVVNDPAHMNSTILCSSQKILFIPRGEEGIDLDKVISFNIGTKTFSLEQIDGDPLYDWPKNYHCPKLAIFQDKLYWPSVSFHERINDGYFFRKEIREFWTIDLQGEQLKWAKTFLAPDSIYSMCYYGSTAFNETCTRIYLFDCLRGKWERNASNCPEICSFYLKPPTLNEIAMEKIVGLIGKDVWKKVEPNYANSITYSTNIKNFINFLNSINKRN